MSPLENLYYAIGELAYALAFSDGEVQHEEREKFHAIVTACIKKQDYDFDISGIIFQIMEKDKIESDTAYSWAMNEIRTNGHYLSPKMKESFINILEKVSEAFPPVTKQELKMLDKFKHEIASIKGDPVFYEKSV